MATFALAGNVLNLGTGLDTFDPAAAGVAGFVRLP